MTADFFFVYLLYSEKILCHVLFVFTVQSPSSVSPIFPDMFYSCLRDSGFAEMPKISSSLPFGSETSPTAIHHSPRLQQCLFQTHCFSCFSQSHDQISDNKQLENMLRNTFVDVASPSLETVLLVTGLGVECGGDTVCHGSRQENTDLQPESRAWTGSGINIWDSQGRPLGIFYLQVPFRKDSTTLQNRATC